MIFSVFFYLIWLIGAGTTSLLGYCAYKYYTDIKVRRMVNMSMNILRMQSQTGSLAKETVLVPTTTASAATKRQHRMSAPTTTPPQIDQPDSVTVESVKPKDE